MTLSVKRYSTHWHMSTAVGINIFYSYVAVFNDHNCFDDCEMSWQAETHRSRSIYIYIYMKCRPFSQALSRWLPIAAAWVRARVWSSGICGGRSGAGVGFLLVLRFPLPIFIPPNSISSQSPGAGKIGQKWLTCRVDLVWTPPPTMRIKKNINEHFVII
jgi:hypothetical protein